MPWSLNRITEEVTKLKRALPLTFDWYTGRTQPPVEQQQIIFWEDVDDEVAKILMRRGSKTYVFTNYLANPGNNSTTILLDNHAHRHATSGSVKADTGLDPIGPYNFTWTGAHTYTPLSNTTPITINASASLTSANMFTASPASGLDTVITRLGNVGIGDEAPTANLSVRSRGVNVSDFIRLNAYAWWDCGDLDGLGNNNAAFSDNQTDIIAQVDKTGNGHNLAASIPSTTKWTLHKGSGAAPGPNNTSWLTPGVNNGRWAPWAGSAFGDPSGWTAFIVIANTTFQPFGQMYFLRGGAAHNIVLNIPDGDHGTNPRDAYYVNYGAGGGTDREWHADLGTPTYWIAQGAEWSAFTWRMTGGAHSGWNQGVSMPNMVDNGGTASSSLSGWDRIFQATSVGSLTGYTYSEIILFNRALSEQERLNVQNYLDVKYGAASSSTGASQPLVHIKDTSGVVDSFVDESLQFGIGLSTTAAVAKVHIRSATAPQVRVDLNASDYFTASVAANGVVTLGAFGSTPSWIIPDPFRFQNYVEFDEMSVPGTPPANRIRLYAKDSTGVSNLYFKKDDGTEIDLGAQGGTVITGEYKFDTSTAASDPGAGKLRFNSATIASVTAIYIDQLSNLGTDIALLLETLRSGDQFLIQDKDNATKRTRYQLTAAPTNNTGWWTMAVSYVSSIGALFGNNERLAVAVFLGPGTASLATDPLWAAKGDLAVGLANDSAGILSKGTDGYFLKADSAETTGLKWVALTGGGDALIANGFGQFAPQTSLQLANTLSDETGSAGGGLAVFNKNPTLTSMTLPVSSSSTTGIAFKDTATPYSWLHDFTSSFSTVGYANVWLGKSSGNFTMVGTNANAIIKGLEASGLVGIGYSVMPSVTTGYSSAGVGSFALNALTTGRYNNAYGSSALLSVVSGEKNSAFGTSALSSATASKLVAVGYAAGSGHTSGDECIFIGADSGSALGTETNAVAIGYGTIVDADNKVTIGNLFNDYVDLRGVINLRDKYSGFTATLDASQLTADQPFSFPPGGGQLWVDNVTSDLASEYTGPVRTGLFWAPAGSPATWTIWSGSKYFKTSLNSTTGVATLSSNVAGGGWVFADPGSTTLVDIQGPLKVSKINKLTITQPATGSTLTIADGKTLTVSRTIQFTADSDTRVLTLNAASTTLAGGTHSGTNTGDQTITLTGDVTGSGVGSFAATIANDAVTYAKIQNVSAASKLLGRGSAGGAGDTEEITLGGGLAMSSTTVDVKNRAVYVPTTADTAINSITDVTIATNDVTGIVAGDQLVVEGSFTILNNSGAGRVYNITLDFDARFAIEIITGSLTNSATSAHTFFFRSVLDVRSTSLSYQTVAIEGSAIAGQASSDNQAMLGTTLFRGMSWATSASDLTGTTTVSLAIRSASATATQTCRLHSLRIHKYSPT